MILTNGLVKRFGKVTALDGLDLVVPQGTILALLGPNGAGKTTAVRILTTLLEPDGGTAEVAGIDLLRHPDEVRKHIGLSGQNAAVDEYLTGYENLEMVGRFYRLGRKAARERARELLARFELVESGDRPAKTYSGGMRRRLDLAAALVASPPVLFLDEPTTGLDPRSRLALWETIRELVKGGSTFLLTTQYMEEADQLADDILVIDQGKMIAHGRSDELKRQVGGERIEVVVRDLESVALAEPVLKGISGAEVQIDHEARRLTTAVTDGAESLRKALQKLKTAQIGVLDVGVRRPTLDDVFLSLTGHAAEDGFDPEPPAAKGKAKKGEAARR